MQPHTEMSPPFARGTEGGKYTFLYWDIMFRKKLAITGPDGSNGIRRQPVVVTLAARNERWLLW